MYVSRKYSGLVIGILTVCVPLPADSRSDLPCWSYFALQNSSPAYIAFEESENIHHKKISYRERRFRTHPFEQWVTWKNDNNAGIICGRRLKSCEPWACNTNEDNFTLQPLFNLIGTLNSYEHEQLTHNGRVIISVFR